VEKPPAAAGVHFGEVKMWQVHGLEFHDKVNYKKFQIPNSKFQTKIKFQKIKFQIKIKGEVT
jgi:hypothetical protein